MIRYNGGSLKLTADIYKDESIKVYVLNFGGDQIGSAKFIKKSITDETIGFICEIDKEKISLKIEIKKAKVYSFKT